MSLLVRKRFVLVVLFFTLGGVARAGERELPTTRKLQRARRFLSELRREADEYTFGGRVSDTHMAKDKVKLLQTYHPVLGTVEALSADPQLGAATRAFGRKIGASMPKDLHGVFKQASGIDLDKPETAAAAKAWQRPASAEGKGPFAALPFRGRTVSADAKPLGTLDAQAFADAWKRHDPAIYKASDAAIDHFMQHIDVDVVTSKDTGDTSYRPDLLDLDVPGGPAALSFVARIIERQPSWTQPKMAENKRAIVRSVQLWLTGATNDRPKDVVFPLDGKWTTAPYALPLLRLARAAGVDPADVVLEHEDGKRTRLSEHPALHQLDAKSVKKASEVLAAFDGKGGDRAKALVTLIDPASEIDLADAMRAAVAMHVAGKLERASFGKLGAAEKKTIVGVLTQDGHLGATTVLTGLLLDGGTEELEKAMVALGHDAAQTKAWMGYARALQQLKGEALRSVLSGLTSEVPSFTFFPARVVMATHGISPPEMKQLFDAFAKADPVGVVEALVDHLAVAGASNKERAAMATFLSERVASGELKREALHAALQQGRALTLNPALDREITAAIGAVAKASAADRRAASVALAKTIRKYEDVVDSAELLTQALGKIHDLGLRVVLPLDEADQQLGGVAGRTKKVAVHEESAAGPLVIGGIEIAANTNEHKDRAAVPRASAAELVMTPTTETNLRNMALKWRLRKPVLLEGPTSAGKTSAVRYLAYKTGSPYRRINLSYYTDVSDLVGRYVGGENKFTQAALAEKSEEELALIGAEYGIDGKVGSAERMKQILDAQRQPRWVDGPLVQALRKGEVLLLDEVNLARPEVLEALNSLFDDDRELRITQHHNEVVKPHPDFRLFATMNPASYAGRAKLSDAMLSRWTRLFCQGLTTKDLTTVMRSKYGDRIPQGELAKLIAAHQALSAAADEGSIGSSLGGVAFSLRNLMRVAQRFIRYRGGALSDDALMRREVEEVYRGGLPEPLDVQAVDDVLTAVMPHKGGNFYDGLEIKETATTFSIGDVTLRKLNVAHSDVPDQRSRLVMTRRTKEIFYRLAKALDNGENPLLIGDRASGKTAIAKMFAHVIGQPYYRQQISGSTDVMELVGGYDDQGWQDRPLLVAGRPDGHGGTLVLDEINMGSSALLERLNPVLDDERQIVLAEKEGETIRMHRDLHVIGTMNPPNQKYGGRKKLSMALQNRATTIFVPELADKHEQKEIMAVLAKQQSVPTPVADALVELHHAVIEGYKDGTLGKDIREEDRPVLSIRQLKAALETVAEFGKKGHIGSAFLRAVEAEYASSPSSADNEAILKLAREIGK